MQTREPGWLGELPDGIRFVSSQSPAGSDEREDDPQSFLPGDLFDRYGWFPPDLPLEKTRFSIAA